MLINFFYMSNKIELPLYAVKNEFNEAHYPELIGTLYHDSTKIPSFVNLKSLRKELGRVIDMLNEKEKTGDVLSTRNLARIMLDEFGFTPNLIDSLLSNWATTSYTPGAFKEYFIEKTCKKSKI